MKKIIFRSLLLIYILLLLSFVCIHSKLGGIGNISYLEGIIKYTNLIPFYNFGPPKSVLISFVIYIPVALLSRDSFNQLSERKSFYAFIIALIVLIEIVQVLTLRGCFDINDIIFGFVGSVIIYELIAKLSK